MQALDKKLLRDFRRLWAQALAIALVLACGVAIFLTSFGMYRALQDTRAAYYERNRFADVFAETRRAPDTLTREIAAIPGVAGVEARVTGSVILDIPGRVETAVGQVISLPDAGLPPLNRPLLRAGRLPDPASTTQVAVNEPFAKAHGFGPGDSFAATINGQKRQLTITGTLLSPEFIYTIGPGQLMPDNEGYGILWMPERAVAAAFDMTGAFNSVSLKLTRGTSRDEVIDRLDDLLDPYGGLGAYGRDIQLSNSFIDAEIASLKSTAAVLPPVFFGISAFLVNMVLGRIIALERAQIGLMKAVGYTDREVAAHYLMLAGLVGLAGIGIGWAVGSWLSHALAVLYADFFDFPYLIYRVSYDVYVISAVIALSAAGLGAVRAALAATRLSPAVAMAPAAPPRFSRGLFDRMLAALRLPQPAMMVLRGILRWPVRSGLTVLGLALAVAVMMAATFTDDSMDEIIDGFFYQSNRQDALLLFSQDQPASVLEEVRRLPGVLAVEGHLYLAAELRNGHLSKQTPIEARRPDSDLSRAVDAAGRVVVPPPGGLILSERLAAELGLRPGDMVEAEFLGTKRETHMLPVSGLAVQYLGLGAYMDYDSANRMFRQAPQVSTASVLIDPAQEDALHARLKDLPGLAGTIMLTDSRRAFEETLAENVLIMMTVYAVIAVLITVGVAYNGARVQLSERARELASLRILGFSRAEVSAILIGETMLLAVLAQPVGWLVGWGLALAITAGFSSDLYAVPLVLRPACFAQASLVVLGASLGAVLLVRRRLDRLDLVAVMKTRE
ncbi:ABC transporter permease [Rhodovulum adriaticum]|uniref:Putative ABC transport system permease protein n=1 Tax=Rhodovulum adriaticum TaxID=35804 RepID=A0A4R2NJF0_RHOAD|nr:ABC transporter permease [Rhodovulum adriaticum]MBK1636618.1 ABC transporter permease [Rhodovulum adriaticum]TCP21355.1 putative ABC transport system permease protein [Rhodovulum adriaticum]